MATFATPDGKTSTRMGKVRSRDTGLEKSMQTILDGLGLQYEIQPNLFGHPDFKLAGEKIMIFCDSSFWHGRSNNDVKGRSFHKNKEFWSEKLAATRRRDRVITRKLTEDEWKVLRFWDTDINQRTESVKNRLTEALNEKR